MAPFLLTRPCLAAELMRPDLVHVFLAEVLMVLMSPLVALEEVQPAGHAVEVLRMLLMPSFQGVDPFGERDDREDVDLSAQVKGLQVIAQSFYAVRLEYDKTRMLDRS